MSSIFEIITKGDGGSDNPITVSSLLTEAGSFDSFEMNTTLNQNAPVFWELMFGFADLTSSWEIPDYEFASWTKPTILNPFEGSVYYNYHFYSEFYIARSGTSTEYWKSSLGSISNNGLIKNESAAIEGSNTSGYGFLEGNSTYFAPKLMLKTPTSSDLNRRTKSCVFGSSIFLAASASDSGTTHYLPEAYMGASGRVYDVNFGSCVGLNPRNVSGIGSMGQLQPRGGALSVSSKQGNASAALGIGFSSDEYSMYDTYGSSEYPVPFVLKLQDIFVNTPNDVNKDKVTVEFKAINTMYEQPNLSPFTFPVSGGFSDVPTFDSSSLGGQFTSSSIAASTSGKFYELTGTQTEVNSGILKMVVGTTSNDEGSGIRLEIPNSLTGELFGISFELESGTSNGVSLTLTSENGGNAGAFLTPYTDTVIGNSWLESNSHANFTESGIHYAELRSSGATNNLAFLTIRNRLEGVGMHTSIKWLRIERVVPQASISSGFTSTTSLNTNFRVSADNIPFDVISEASNSAGSIHKVKKCNPFKSQENEYSEYVNLAADHVKDSTLFRKTISAGDYHPVADLTTYVKTISVNPDLEGKGSLHFFHDVSIDGDSLANTDISIADITIHTCENAYVSKDSSGHLEYFYRPSETNTPPPIMYQDIPTELLGQNVNVNIDITLSEPYSGEGHSDLVLDFGEGTVQTQIESSTSGTELLENRVVDGTTLRVYAVSATTVGVKAIVEVLNVIKVAETEKAFIAKYGDISSQELNYVQGVRIWNPAAGGDLAFLLSQELQVPSINSDIEIEIKVDSLSSTSTITMTTEIDGTLEDMVYDSSDTSAAVKVFRFPDSKLNNPSISFRVESLTNQTYDVSIDYISVKSTPLIVGNSGDSVLDLSKEETLPITFCIKDFKSLGSSNSDYSKTISLPATRNNSKALLHKGNLDSIRGADESNDIDCEIYTEGALVSKGKVRLNEVNLVNGVEDSFEVSFKGGNGDWVSELKDKNLKELSSSSINLLRVSDIFASAADNHSDIVVPLVDVGKWGYGDFNDYSEGVSPAKVVKFENLRPAYRLKNVFDRIFESIGYSVESLFFNGNSDFSNEFGYGFNNDWNNLLGIAANASRSDEEVKKSKISLTITNQLISAIDIPELDSTFGNWINTIIYSHEEDEFFAWYGYRHLSFDSIDIDEQSEVSTWTSESFGSLEINGTTMYHSGVNAGSSGATLISPSVSGYYDIAFEASISASLNEEYLACLVFVESTKTTNSSLLNSVYWNGEKGLGSFLLDNAVELASPDSWSGSNDFHSHDLRIELTQYLQLGKTYAPVILYGKQSPANLLHNPSMSVRINSASMSLALKKELIPSDNYQNHYKTNNTPLNASFSEVLPDKFQLEFISDISKMYNLCWQSNPVTKQITVEPYNDFFDWEGTTFGYDDWSDIASLNSIETNSILNKALHYKMKSDASDSSLKKGVSSDDSFGNQKVYLDSTDEDEFNKIELSIFACAKMGEDKNLAFNFGDSHYENLRLIRIYQGDSVLPTYTDNELKPDISSNHEHKLAYFKGFKSLNSNNSKYYFNIANSDAGGFENEFYNYFVSAESYGLLTDGDVMPTLSFSEQTLSGTNNYDGGLYNNHHQRQIEMLKVKDKFVTADVALTPNMVSNFNFRRLVTIDNNIYIVNKIKGFSAASKGTTEVELVLVTPRGLNEKI